MKLKFFVESLKYHPESKTPSIIVYITNKIDHSKSTSPVFVTSEEDLDKAKKIMEDKINEYHTSFIYNFTQYKESGIAVGDIIEMDITVSNEKEILN